ARPRRRETAGRRRGHRPEGGRPAGRARRHERRGPGDLPRRHPHRQGLEDRAGGGSAHAAAHGDPSRRPRAAHLPEGAALGTTAMKYTRPAFVVFVLVTLQTSMFAELDFFGAKGDVMLLLPIAAGINGGRDRGALVGFLTGLTLDLVVHGTPIGFFALG